MQGVVGLAGTLGSEVRWREAETIIIKSMIMIIIDISCYFCLHGHVMNICGGERGFHSQLLVGGTGRDL